MFPLSEPSVSKQSMTFKATERKLFQLLFFLSCCSVFIQNPVYGDDLSSEIKVLETFSKVYNLIKNRYVNHVDSQELILAAVSGMVKSLDPYSAVLTQKDMEKLELHSVGQYVGIGVTIQKSKKQFIVTQVHSESPAAQSGLKPGDKIIKIDSELLEGKKDTDIHRFLLGEVGTEVNLELIPVDQPEITLTRKIQRKLIKANSVDCHEQEEEIQIIAVYQFLKHTAREISKCLGRRSHRVVILDLRNNPGGLLISAVEVAELFIDMGEVVQIRNRRNQVIEKYISRRRQSERAPAVFVLINKYSASSAEILAGGIKDRKAGVLIGEQSFGKGVVQSIYPIGPDLFIKLTTAHYYTPSDVNFDGVGIEPDFLVQDDAKGKRYDKSDLIFQKALVLAREKLSH